MSNPEYHVGEKVRFMVCKATNRYGVVTITERKKCANGYAYRFKELGKYIKSTRRIWVMGERFQKHAKTTDFDAMMLKLKLGKINNHFI